MQCAKLVAWDQRRAKLFQILRLELHVVNHKAGGFQDFERCDKCDFAGVADTMELAFRCEESPDARAVQAADQFAILLCFNGMGEPSTMQFAVD